MLVLLSELLVRINIQGFLSPLTFENHKGRINWTEISELQVLLISNAPSKIIFILHLLVMWIHCKHSREDFQDTRLKLTTFNSKYRFSASTSRFRIFFFCCSGSFSSLSWNGMPRAILPGLFKQPLQRRAIIILHYWYGKIQWVNVIVTRRELPQTYWDEQNVSAW